MRSLKQQRQDARFIFEAGLEAADPVVSIRRHLQVNGPILHAGESVYDLTKYKNVYVVGAGKATAKMALAVEELLDERITGGIVIVKRGHTVPLRKLEIVEAGHPIPDQAGVNATETIVGLLRRTLESDLILCLISGGASALLASPRAGLSLQDKQQTTQALLNCGATIHEVNAIRKHISKVKGGRLAELAYPSTVISLVLSDVIGDAVDIIGSGPTAPDSSTFADCLSIIEQYGVGKMIPGVVRGFLQKGAAGETAETVKAGDPIFHKVQNLIVGNNRFALSAAKERAEALGYHTLVLSNSVDGEAKKVGIDHADIAKDVLAGHGRVNRPACIISGGETTVTIQGDGLGGRNQEFALAAAVEIDGMAGVVVLGGGTDGTDGPTDAAGAIVDGTTLQRAREKGLDARDYLQRNDSYPLLKTVGDLLVTGPTLTNVMDLRLVLVA
ncbi:MAG TPA: glycerate kinase [Candidatus Binatia bacterium]|nr:glycerate kinase [Candidatus Binatia bacterium]